MRARIVMVGVAALLAGCSPEAAPYRNPFDRLGVELDRIGWVTFWPCASSTQSGEFVIVESLSNEHCYRLDQSERLRGVWLAELEGSEFLPDATVAPTKRDLRRLTEDDCIWLDMNVIDPQIPDAIAGDPETAENFPSPAAYVIDFVGRRSIYPSVYGGGCRHLVVVDNLISARAIRPPRGTNRDELGDHLRNWSRERDRRVERMRPKTALRRWLLPCPVFICRSPPEPAPDVL